MSGWACEKLDKEQLNLAQVSFSQEKITPSIRGTCLSAGDEMGCTRCPKGQSIIVDRVYRGVHTLGTMHPVES